MSEQTCPLCNGKGRGKIRQANITAIAPCPICDNGRVNEVGMTRYRLCRDLERIEKEGKIKNFPMSNPDLSWEV